MTDPDDTCFAMPSGELIPYRMSLDEDGYCYEIYIDYDKREGMIFVCEAGCHVEWEDQPDCWYDTNIVPERIFGKLTQLEDSHLVHITNLLISTGFEGKFYDDKATQLVYNSWLREMGNE